MRRYQYKIFLDSGESRVDLSILAKDENEAIEKFNSIRESADFQENIKGMKITQILLDFEGEAIDDIDPSRFDFKPSDNEKDFYVVVDKKTMIYIKFRKKHFNTQQEPVFLDDRQLDASTMAESMRSIGDYMHEYHSDVI